jgi:hypothetical protein
LSQDEVDILYADGSGTEDNLFPSELNLTETISKTSQKEFEEITDLLDGDKRDVSRVVSDPVSLTLTFRELEMDRIKKKLLTEAKRIIPLSDIPEIKISSPEAKKLVGRTEPKDLKLELTESIGIKPAIGGATQDI